MIQARPAVPSDASAITDIYNVGIAGRTTTYEMLPLQVEDISERLKHVVRYPLLVATDDDGSVIGWAGLSSYRARDCYAGIGEFSVYLATDARGRGVGRNLLNALIAAAQDRGYWKLLSRIFLFNTASRALCRSVGFREVGIYEKHGQLEGRWLDVVIVERLIPETISQSTSAAEVAAAF